MASRLPAERLTSAQPYCSNNPHDKEQLLGNNEFRGIEAAIMSLPTSSALRARVRSEYNRAAAAGGFDACICETRALCPIHDRAAALCVLNSARLELDESIRNVATWAACIGEATRVLGEIDTQPECAAARANRLAELAGLIRLDGGTAEQRAELLRLAQSARINAAQ